MLAAGTRTPTPRAPRSTWSRPSKRSPIVRLGPAGTGAEKRPRRSVVTIPRSRSAAPPRRTRLTTRTWALATGWPAESVRRPRSTARRPNGSRRREERTARVRLPIRAARDRDARRHALGGVAGVVGHPHADVGARHAPAVQPRAQDALAQRGGERPVLLGRGVAHQDLPARDPGRGVLDLHAQHAPVGALEPHERRRAVDLHPPVRRHGVARGVLGDDPQRLLAVGHRGQRHPAAETFEHGTSSCSCTAARRRRRRRRPAAARRGCRSCRRPCTSPPRRGGASRRRVSSGPPTDSDGALLSVSVTRAP